MNKVYLILAIFLFSTSTLAKNWKWPLTPVIFEKTSEDLRECESYSELFNTWAAVNTDRGYIKIAGGCDPAESSYILNQDLRMDLGAGRHYGVQFCAPSSELTMYRRMARVISTSSTDILLTILGPTTIPNFRPCREDYTLVRFDFLVD